MITDKERKKDILAVFIYLIIMMLGVMLDAAGTPLAMPFLLIGAFGIGLKAGKRNEQKKQTQAAATTSTSGTQPGKVPAAKPKEYKI